MLKMLLSICPITEGDSSPSVLSDSRSKSNSEMCELRILRWLGARCMIVFKHSFFTWPHWISWGSWGGQGQGCKAVFKHSFTWPHCLIFPVKIMDFQEFLHLGNSTSSCYNPHSTEQNLSPFHKPVTPCCPQSTEKLAYARPWTPDSEWTELWSEQRLDTILVSVAHFKSTLCRDKGELLRWVEAVPHSPSMCVMSVWPHYHRLLGNRLVGRVSGDSGSKRSHVRQSLRTLLLSHFVIEVTISCSLALATAQLPTF